MNDIKKIALKFLYLALLLVLMNFAYKYFRLEKDQEEHSGPLELVKDLPNDCQILYLGESSNITRRWDDTDKRYIHEFMAAYYPNMNVCHITKSASHAEVYKIFLQNIPDDSKIETVIVTLNLRSFNADWINSMLETSIQKYLVLMRNYPPLVRRLMLGFKAYDNKTVEERIQDKVKFWEEKPLYPKKNYSHSNTREWDKWMATKGAYDSLGNYSKERTRLSCHYIKGYAFQIDTLTNPRINDFNDIIKLANKQGWNLVFNLMAENVDKASELVGNELIQIMNDNSQLLIDYYTRKGVTVVNNLCDVRDEQFIDRNWTTEHYAQIGRMTIGSTLADSLRVFHPNEYFDAKLLSRHVFLNDFETNYADFDGFAEYSTKHKWSGNRSSKISKQHPYSQTFIITPSLHDLSKYQTIHISAQILSNTGSSNASLIIESRENDSITDWHKFQVNDVIISENRWQYFSINYPINEELLSADKTKIFFINSKNEELFIDDFKIILE
jgi:hypothetical protein